MAGAVWLGLRVYDATRPVAAPSAAAPSVVPAAALPPPIAASVPPSANPSGAPSSSSPTLDPARPRPLQYDSRGVPIIPKNPSAAELQQALVAIFDRDGIPYGSPTAASADADSVCEYLDSGHRSFADLVAWIRRARPSLMSDQVGGFAGASIGVYCPRYGYLIDSTNEGATS
ncbi:DUF732 domain-containing protein [Mycobacterium mantenii]|uniref:DUF732 domain-containing protein n=1 Tax=Mycobacterium mantenii TaxID=560555 RepID=UPI0035584163